MLNRLVDAWTQKEQARDGLVPDTFAEPGNQQRLRTAAWVRGLLALVVAGLAVVFFVGPALATPVLAALLGALGFVAVILVVIGVRALSALAAVERESAAARDGDDAAGANAGPGPGGSDGSAAAGRTGDEGTEFGQRVDLEHENRVQSDDVE